MKDNIEKVGGVYQIENIITHKIYIGSSKDIGRRWKQHIKMLVNNKHHSTHLQNSWNKYGSDNFKFTIIEIVNNEDFKENKDKDRDKDKEYSKFLRDREQYYMDTFQSYNSQYGYNISKDATGGGNLFTFEDLHNGKCPFTEDQFWQIVEELQDPYTSVVQLARNMGLKEKVVQKIADMGYFELCKDIFIPKRQSYYQNWDNDLEDYGIKEIIDELREK